MFKFQDIRNYFSPGRKTQPKVEKEVEHTKLKTGKDKRKTDSVQLHGRTSSDLNGNTKSKTQLSSANSKSRSKDKAKRSASKVEKYDDVTIIDVSDEDPLSKKEDKHNRQSKTNSRQSRAEKGSDKVDGHGRGKSETKKIGEHSSTKVKVEKTKAKKRKLEVIHICKMLLECSFKFKELNMHI